MTYENLVKDVINKVNVIVSLNLQQMDLIFKSWLMLFFVYL